MSSTLTRRAIVAGTATLPVALAVPVLASTEPVNPATAKLVALGERLKPLLVQNFELSPRVHKAHRDAQAAAGYFKLLEHERITGSRPTERQRKRAERRFQETRKQTGYDKLYVQWNELCGKMHEIAELILEIETTDSIGDGIHAAAALVLGNDIDDWHAQHDYTETEVLLWKIAARAGFPMPSWVQS